MITLELVIRLDFLLYQNDLGDHGFIQGGGQSLSLEGSEGQVWGEQVYCALLLSRGQVL